MARLPGATVEVGAAANGGSSSVASRSAAITIKPRGKGTLQTMHAFLLIMVVATGLRVNGITFDSMWLDESYQTVIDAIGINPQTLHKLADHPIIYSPGEPRSVKRVLWNFRMVDYLCPPLYFVMLNRWLTVFGTTDFAIRSLSAVFSILSVAVIFFGTRKLFNAKTALWAAAIMALSPYDIYYAQEARMYALITLTASISCFSFYLFIRQIRERTSRRVGSDSPLSKSNTTSAVPISNSDSALPVSNLALVVSFLVYSFSTWAMVNTHYTTLTIAVFQGLFGIIYSIKAKNWRLLGCLASAWLTVFGLWYPLLWMFEQAVSLRDCFYVSREATWWWPLAAIVRIFRNWMSFMTGPRVGTIALGAYATSAILLFSALFVGLRKSPAVRLSWLGSSFRRSPFFVYFRKSEDREPLYVHKIPSEAGVLRQSEVVPDSQRGALLFVFLWALVPALVAIALDISGNRRTVEISRYLIGTAPAIFILAAIGAQRLASMKKLKWLVGLHIVFLLANYTHLHTTFQREPWREMAKLIDQKVDPHELLLIAPHFDMMCVNRYLTVPRMQVGSGPRLGIGHVHPILEGRRNFWLMTSREGNSIAALIPARYAVQEVYELGHGLKLSHYVAPR